MPSQNASTRQLLAAALQLEFTTFTTSGRIDARRYLARTFPVEFPLLILPQDYPDYRRLAGENWLHWHDYYEMLVMVRGHGELVCGMNSFEFGPGDVVAVDPLKMHGVSRLLEPHSSVVILFHGAAVAPTAAGPDLGFLSAWDRRAEGVIPIASADDPAATPLREALVRLLKTHRRGERAVELKFHFLEVLFALRNCFPQAEATAVEDPGARRRRQETLSKVLAYLSRHCGESLTQPAVAQVASMSASAFREFFRETTGWGFSEYVRGLRVDRAARMLRETSESVAEIAQATGFADQSHLNKCFTAQHGIGPLAYRRGRGRKVRESHE